MGKIKIIEIKHTSLYPHLLLEAKVEVNRKIVFAYLSVWDNEQYTMEDFMTDNFWTYNTCIDNMDFMEDMEQYYTELTEETEVEIFKQMILIWNSNPVFNEE